MGLKRKRIFTEEEKTSVVEQAILFLKHIDDKQEEEIWDISMRLEISEDQARSMWDAAMLKLGGYS